MRNDPITDAIEYAHDHPIVVAGAAYVLGATDCEERRELLRQYAEYKRQQREEEEDDEQE